MLKKILIANRGEIARRIQRTAYAMGIETVAVYSEADQQALHVRECDEALCLGGPEASDSYLNINKLVAAALSTGAQAVHPGYGFLSENADFARACQQAGLVFIGPSEQAIRIMGDKAQAKACVQAAGVALISGYFGDDQSLPTLAREADRITYPLMIKALAGGGGKGIRTVNQADELQSALQSCQREARNAFGDDRIMLEKQIVNPRHVEVQVFADTQGHVVHLFERDCSAQRRHQKVIEEAPAWGLSEPLRQKLGETAVEVAKAVGYVGAGTVEFLLDASGAFYFMEMNTRLQVEHPVTEMVTGFDLVRWQLLVAAGEPLPVQQHDIVLNGHALEARIYAENPEQGFLPATGCVSVWELPKHAVQFHVNVVEQGSRVVRFDGAAEKGLHVTPYYDPMIGKLITWGATRGDAVAAMLSALAQLRCIGVKNNIAWLHALCEQNTFQQGGYDTGLIERCAGVLNTHHLLGERRLPLLLGLAVWAKNQPFDVAVQDPLARLDGFSASIKLLRRDEWRVSGQGVVTRSHVRAEALSHVELQACVSAELAAGSEVVMSEETFGFHVDGSRVRGVLSDGLSFDLIWDDDLLYVFLGEQQTLFEWQNPAQIQLGQADSTGGVLAPMPGKVFAVFVKVGDVVKKGQALIGLEAMKMEHTLLASQNAVIKTIPYGVGEQVQEGVQLIHFDDGEG